MADQLVKLLNQYRYQPVFLPRTGLLPPELYNFVKPSLKRRGPLAGLCLSGCFSKPQAVVYGRAAPSISENLARVPIDVR